MKVPEKYRIKGMSTPAQVAGYYHVPTPHHKKPLMIVASDGMGWEHVSISLPTRCPNWDEMCLVKSLFWDDEEVVMQLHAKKSEWVSNHPYCLHLWRPTDAVIPTPPQIMVGIQSLGNLS